MLTLVTGANGFLGAHVIHTLVDHGDTVRAMVRPDRPRNHIRKIGIDLVEGNMLDEESLRRACDGVDSVVHCAAQMGYWSRQDSLQRKVNVEGTSALLRSAQAAGVRRIVHVSSVAAVGASASGEVLDEGTSWNLAERGVNYALTKRLGEERALAAAWGGMPVVVVNPSALFGPRLDGRPSSELISGITRGRLPWIPPGGISVADVSDVANGVVAALRSGRPGERYILGGHNVTWEQLYTAIAACTGGRVPEKRLGARRLKWLTLAARGRDALHISRPPWTPELYRSYGMYSWVRSEKAATELGYSVRPLAQIIAHATQRR